MLLSASLARPAPARPAPPARTSRSPLPTWPNPARRASAVAPLAATPTTKPPSLAPGKTELDVLAADTCVVPDVMLMGSTLGSPDVLAPQAATVSSSVLVGLIAGTAGAGAREMQVRGGGRGGETVFARLTCDFGLGTLVSVEHTPRRALGGGCRAKKSRRPAEKLCRRRGEQSSGELVLCMGRPSTLRPPHPHALLPSSLTHTNQIAIERAVQQHKGDPSAALEAATVSVGALFAKRVAGRVSTEVDPRLADDEAGLVAKGKAIAAAYATLGVKPDKFLLRIPATWAGIAAAGALEKAGLRTHMTNVASLVQASAAAQAGVAVVQPSVAALSDWYRAFPNAIRNPKGPREDAGGSPGATPGVDLVARIWCYMRRFHPGTAIMASGVRTREEALSLSGVDYLVTGPKVLAALAAKPTTAGYNDGLSGAGGAGESGPALNATRAAAMAFDEADTAPVTKQLFEEGLGAAGRDLLVAGVERLQADVDRVLPAMQNLVVGGV